MILPSLGAHGRKARLGAIKLARHRFDIIPLAKLGRPAWR